MQIITNVAEITALIREADEIFETVGGGTRHYVRDVLMPLMEEKGIAFCTTEPAISPTNSEQ
jgi:hypothetical protein